MDPGFHEVCRECTGRTLCFARGINYCVAHQGLYPSLDIPCEFVEKRLTGLYHGVGDHFLRCVSTGEFNPPYVRGFQPGASFAVFLQLVDPIRLGVCRVCVPVWVGMAREAIVASRSAAVEAHRA